MIRRVMRLNGSILINARHKKGMNQQTLADACDLSLQTISKAENEGELYPATAKTICDYLGIDMEEDGVVLPIGKDGDAA